MLIFSILKKTVYLSLTITPPNLGFAMKKYLIILLVFNLLACRSEKPVLTIDTNVIVNESLQSSLSQTQCEQKLKQNLETIPFNFVSIDEGFFISEHDVWKANIQCLQHEILMNVQAKKTVVQGLVRLDQPKANLYAQQLKQSIKSVITSIQ